MRRSIDVSMIGSAKSQDLERFHCRAMVVVTKPNLRCSSRPATSYATA